MIDNPLIEIEGYVVYVYGERKKKTLNISFFVHHLHKFIHNTMLEAKKWIRTKRKITRIQYATVLLVNLFVN